MLVVEFFFINIDTVQSSDFSILVILCTIWYHWDNFKKREKQLQPATLVEVSLLHGCLFKCTFFKCTNGTKSRKAFYFLKHFLQNIFKWLQVFFRELHRRSVKIP